MQERLKYSSKDRESVKYCLFYYLFRMRVIDEDELIELFAIINEIYWSG